MADAAARREARRRRILENSHNRLQLISGKSGDDSPSDSPVRSLNLDQERDVSLFHDSSSHKSTCLNNGAIVNEPETYGSLLADNDIVAAGDGDLSSDLASFINPATFTTTTNLPNTLPFGSPTPEPTQTTSLFEKIITYKYDIVLLSLLIQLLDWLSLITTEDIYFFIPVIIYTVTKFIWFPEKSNSGLASALLLLNSPSSARLHKMFQVAQYASVIGRDICVFLFTTICIQSLSFVLKEWLIT
ncbi:hypothetical protein K1T71_009853 [Dendrolimus kikuchii]|uniref:Uncharacterized protein n=1 Tax=Dendrolimus kikuchii TaxID=765133 RepID=A0ACC1CT93_9NEOP|nr:hypothetical protein K1T71_009853 [Dendrolimus kikuchii]